ncbi:Fungal fucose-specific lectin [Penicillium occitanis (nom. inval.)]|nr:hypothetical protein PENOC_107630 [Penicillium occitanis (nom. inval.)]PCG94814.1 Fungal fucose-specific lectin [Penicillium occitanis (nom. inval.)]
MSRPANLDVIEFIHANTRQLRVYYQSDGEQTSHTDQELSTPWTSTIITEGLLKVEIEPSSGLAVSLPGNQGQPLRLFFQEKANGDTGPLRELQYNYAQKAWQLLKGRIVADALKGTRLSAASDNVTKALRLYYQASDMALCEVACDRYYRWGGRTSIQKDLIPQAPISVVSWDSGQPVPEIRVYTVTSAASRRILELSYTFPSWKTAVVPAPGYRNPSGMAACRNTSWDVNSQSPIYFFHQPGGRAIALTLLPVDDSTGSRMLSSKILPLANLPITIDGPVGTGSEGEDKKEEQVIEKLRKDLSDSKLEADQLRSANEELTTKLEAAQNKASKAGTSTQDILVEFFKYTNRIPETLKPADIFYALQWLYSEGFDVNGSDTTGAGRSGLVDVIKVHGKSIVTLLLSRDIDFQAADAAGDTPLNAACRYEEEDVVRALLERGSNPNVKDKKGQTPLHEAAGRRKKSIVPLLLDKGASVDSRNADGDTPLHLASRSGSQEIILLLLQKNADINAKNFKGDTPLFYADSIPTIQLLIQRGARVNELNNKGFGRLHFAVMMGETSIVQYLVDSRQADINLQSPGEPTPLHLAVSFQREPLVRLFLAAGVDRNRLCGGWTPLEYAKRDKLSSMIQLLQ